MTYEVKGEITQVNAAGCVIIKLGQLTLGNLVMLETQFLLQEIRRSSNGSDFSRTVTQ
jgi:hypothetical protein